MFTYQIDVEINEVRDLKIDVYRRSARMRCYAMLRLLCYAMLCYAVLCFAMLAMLCLLCYAMLCYTRLDTCHAACRGNMLCGDVSYDE